jgi:hypothetical protein
MNAGTCQTRTRRVKNREKLPNPSTLKDRERSTEIINERMPAMPFPSRTDA